jgi:hypothetical protein
MYTLAREQINKGNITTTALDNLKAGYPICAELVITPTTGSAITVRDDDLLQGSFEISRDGTSGDLIRIGTAISSELKFTLDNNPVAQCITTHIIGTITGAGNASVVITASGMTGSPVTRSVAVSVNDTASVVAGKIRTNLNDYANITNFFIVGGTGETITLTAKLSAINDTTMNISVNNGTCSGLTYIPTSIITISGKRGFDSFVFEGAEISAKCLWLKDETHAYEFALGTFTIDEVPRKLKSISITALDAMAQFDKYFDTSVMVFPLQLDDLVYQCCTDCGVTWDTTNSLMTRLGNYTVSYKPAANNLTYRQIIAWAAQLSGASAFIDWTNKLRITWYTVTSDSQFTTADHKIFSTITSSERYTSDLKENDIQITGVKIIGNDKDKTTYLNGTENYAIVIDGNLLAQDNLSALATALGGYLVGFTYRPYSCTVKSFPHLQPYDGLTFVDASENEISSVITNVKFRLKGNTSLEGKGETAVKKGYATANPLTSSQQAILDRLISNPQSVLSSQQSAIIKLNEAIAHGINLFETTIGGITYRHNLADIAESDYICVTNSSGFAWTTSGWNGGNPTWEYGLASDGSAVFDTVTATRFVADNIVAGKLTAPDGVCYFDLSNDYINVGNGSIGGFTATSTMLSTGGGTLGIGTKAGIGSNPWGECSIFAGGYSATNEWGWNWNYAKVSYYDSGTGVVTVTSCDESGNYLNENIYDGDNGDTIEHFIIEGLTGTKNSDGSGGADTYNSTDQTITLYERNGYMNSIKYTHTPVYNTGIGAMIVYPKFHVKSDGTMHAENAEISGSVLGALSVKGSVNKLVIADGKYTGSTGNTQGLYWTAENTDISLWKGDRAKMETDSKAIIDFYKNGATEKLTIDSKSAPLAINSDSSGLGAIELQNNTTIVGIATAYAFNSPSTLGGMQIKIDNNIACIIKSDGIYDATGTTRKLAF